jgi:hypothetical protein
VLQIRAISKVPRVPFDNPVPADVSAFIDEVSNPLLGRSVNIGWGDQIPR